LHDGGGGTLSPVSTFRSTIRDVNEGGSDGTRTCALACTVPIGPARTVGGGKRRPLDDVALPPAAGGAPCPHPLPHVWVCEQLVEV
jgi:hypothetical protein